MRYLLTLVVGVGIACGGSSPTTPTPTPTPSAQLVILPGDVQYFEEWKGLQYAGKGQNAGTGCATHVAGTVAFRDKTARVVQTSAWTLDPTRIVRPSETFDFSGCCLLRENAAAVDGGSATVAFTWDNVRC